MARKTLPGTMVRTRSLWERVDELLFKREPTGAVENENEDDKDEFRLKPGITYKGL